MLNVIVFGAPGSGKGTQSERLINEYGLHHISTGEVLRDHIARGTDLGKVADSYISKGQLIPDDLMLKVLENVLDENPEKTAKGVIFDGFPRTIPQAEALKQMMVRRNTPINSVIGLEVEENQLIDRMLRRGQESGRADDNIDTIRQRLNVYHNQTSPLRDYYLNEGKYVAVDGNRPVDVIFADIKGHLDKHLDK